MTAPNAHSKTEHHVSVPDSVPTFLPFKGPFRRWPRASEYVLIALVFWASIFVPSDNETHNQAIVLRQWTEVPLLMWVLVSVASVSLYWRKQYPMVVLACTLVIQALSTSLGYSFDFFGVPVVLYSVGRYETRDRLSQLGGCTIALISVILLFDPSERIPDIGFAFVFLFLAWYFGRRVRARGDYLRLLKERAEQLEREKLFEAQQAVDAERARIARELHDVVAHQVSMMTVQSSAARMLMPNETDKALLAIHAVEEAGRQALIELRHLLGVLRPQYDEATLTPQPSTKDLPALIQRFRAAGISVCMEVVGVLPALTSGMDLSIYRIVQEALTNVLKHAGKGASAEVRLEVMNKILVLSIENPITQPLKNQDDPRKSGYGLVGMRERCTLQGGQFEAGTSADQRFTVICHLPLTQETDV